LKVAIVGAGIAGLAAAQELLAGGCEPVVYEKSDSVGGRCATQIIGPYTFDSGVTSITPRGKALEFAMFERLKSDDLVKIELPIYVHSYGRISQGDRAKNAIPRFTYRNGNVTLPKLLAEGVDVATNRHVAAIGREKDIYLVDGTAFDAIVLTPPLPQTESLLDTLTASRPFSNARYRPCLSVLLGYDVEWLDPRYHAVIDPEQRHPLTWLSLESVKSPDRAPEGHTAMVAQLSPEYSRSHFDHPDDIVVEEAVSHIVRLVGSRFQSPVSTGVERWRFSQPETTALFDTVNRPGSTLMIASDGIVGGRVELAYEAGQRCAKMLMERKV